jgi:hypothetical protein
MEIIEIKKSITFIEEHMDKTDKVYVSHSSRYPFTYYNEIGFMKINTHNIIYGKHNNLAWNGHEWISDTTMLSNDLSLISGRVWFLFTKNADEYFRMQFLKSYFELKGYNIIQEFHATGSDVYLYDINNQQDG